MPWYRAGTVAVTLNSNAVIGSNTAFMANCRVGDAFIGPDGAQYEVTNIASNTALSITPNYRSASTGAGAYALMPVQGYTKDLADQARTMIQQWGSTLAGLGAVSIENVVPVTKGGTGGTTQAAARNGLGLGTAAVAAIVGTVSQAAGVATGAIFERGSNANGDYTKLADGTMICRKRVLAPTFATAAYLQVEWQFPAVFIEPPVILPSGVAGIDQIRYNRGVPGANQSMTSSTIRVFATSSDAFLSTDSSTLQGLAIGRWFA